MDAISTLLDAIRVYGAVYFSKIIHPPWGMEVDARPGYWRFHLVLTGSTWIAASGSSNRAYLSSGDFVIVPRGEAHVLRNEEDGPVTSQHRIPGSELMPVPEFADETARNGEIHLLCGYFQFAQGTPLALLNQLPSLLVVRDASLGQSGYSRALIGIIRQELQNHGAGPQVVLNRLSEILFYCAVRQWLDSATTPGGTLAALADAGLQRALSAIHLSPEEPWTVDDLARISGCSRTTFSNRFRAATGLAPIKYATYWRIELACRLLSESRLGLDEIASRIGYTDSNAFSRAFSRMKGVAPGAYRKASRKQIQ